MRRLLGGALATVLTALLLSGSLAFAAPAPSTTNPAYQGIQCNGPAQSSPVCNKNNPDQITGKNGILVKVTRLVALAAGFAAVVIIIAAGISFITSNGDSSKVSKSRQMIIFALLGLVVIGIAQAVVTFIVSRV